ncbi:MAG: hypothetical protein ABSB38_01115 [Dehalococcoidia bacterium]
MKNIKSIRTGFIVFISVGLVISSSACLNKPTGTPPPGGQIIVKQSGGAGMLIKECTDKSYITQTADYIIEGTVEKVDSMWNEGRAGIFTYTDLRIENYVKGAPFAGNELQIVTPGGTVGEVSQWVEDQPIFHEGKKVRIYFQEVSGEYVIVCGQFGVEER